MSIIPRKIKDKIKEYKIEGAIGGYHTLKWDDKKNSGDYFTVRGRNGMPLCVFIEINGKWDLTDDYKKLKPKKISASITSDEY